jgi:AraC-like DNA-binding protein
MLRGVGEYVESAAPRTGAVLWSRTVTAARETRILPDGCMDLIWSSRTGLFIAGPDTTAQLGRSEAGETFVGLRFPPAVGPAVFGVAAHELTDRSVRLSAVWPDRVARELAERVAAAATGAGELLDAVAAARLREHGGPDRLGIAIVAGLAAGWPVAATARAVGLSARQLQRRSHDLFGYGPKTLARILRMRRALALLGGGLPVAVAAADAGYADQPHLAREVRALAGVPLGELRTD